MFWNYLKTALRLIKKQKVSAAINIFGLSIGIAVVIFIFLFINYELGFDSHIENSADLYRVVFEAKTPSGIEYSGVNFFPLAQSLRNDFPDLPAVAQTDQLTDATVKIDDREYDLSVALFVEPDFYEMMQPNWIIEDVNRGADPSSVILTESLSRKFFGDLNSVGRRIKLNKSVELTVSGIISDPPKQTSLPYEMLISWGAITHFYKSDYLTRWNYLSGTSQTYLRLPEMQTISDFEAKLDKFKYKYLDEEDHETISFRLQSLKEIHLDARFDSYTYTTSRRTLLTLGSIAFLILLIACINFVNLTTAKAIKRAREMGIRKALGADKKMLVHQVIGETFVFIIISIILGFVIFFFLKPYLTVNFGITLDTTKLFSSISIVFFGLFALFLLMVNGLYPAFVLAQYQPVEAFKGSQQGLNKGSKKTRNALVLFQFAVTQVLIVLTLIIAKQSNFILKKDLGFKKENIVIIKCPSYYNDAANEALRGRWLQNPHIRDVSFAYRAPSHEDNIITVMQHQDTESKIVMKPCDSHYLDVYEIPLLAGVFFRKNVANDDQLQWVVSEEAVRKFGFASPEEAISKVVEINGQTAPIIGVVKDFHSFSLQETIKPVVLFNTWPFTLWHAHINLDGGDLSETMKYINKVWKEKYPDESFEYSFLEDNLKMRYEATARTLKLIQLSTFLAIGLGCLGLLGLVFFVLAQMTKEISIRKILGASVFNLYFQVVRYFIGLILAANLISWPVAWWLSKEWLNSFAYKVSYGEGIFILGSLMVIGMALLVISFQVIKSVKVNPVEVLKYE